MIKPLTSLRFFFAFFVFLSHLSFLKTDPAYESLFNNIFSEGFLGVSFFFTLSGFILALNYREKFKNKSITLKKFFVARFARIYPLFFVTTIASIPLVQINLKILFCNLLLLQSYIPQEKYYFSYNAPSWSISDEMFFYLLFPILIGISYHFKNIYKVVLCVVFSIVILLLNTFLPPEKVHYWIYISPFTRVFDFILGIVLFDVYRYLKKTKVAINLSVYSYVEIGVFAVLMIFFLSKDYFPISYRYSTYYWIPMFLLILAASGPLTFGEKRLTLMQKFLSHRWLVYLGEISFGFYLIHYLVISYVLKYQHLFIIQLDGIALTAIMFFITLITSIFAFEIIEKPLNKKIKNLFS